MCVCANVNNKRDKSDEFVLFGE